MKIIDVNVGCHTKLLENEKRQLWAACATPQIESKPETDANIVPFEFQVVKDIYENLLVIGVYSPSPSIPKYLPEKKNHFKRLKLL